MVLIGEDLTEGSSSRPTAPTTFATIESALDWLLESPGTRDLRVTALSKEQPMRHVVGHFALDPDLAGIARNAMAQDDETVFPPSSPSPD